MIREDTKKRARKQIYLQFLSASAEYLAASKIRKASEKTNLFAISLSERRVSRCKQDTN